MEPAQSHRGDVLVVDDTPENIGFLSSMLKGKGFRVRAATSGPMALQVMRAEAPEIVLLDINMPLMDGFEACERIVADPALRDIPVIFLSALSETGDKVRAFGAGGVDYVTKPFKVEEVTARIETHLALRRARRELGRRHRELEESYARLEKLEHVRKSLVEMIVHDLKNPLAAIQVCVDLVRAEGGLAPDQQGAVDDIGSMTRVLHRMVMDVLDVGRGDEAALKPRHASFDPRRLLADLDQDMSRRALAAGRELRLLATEGLPAEVTGDHELLRRLAENCVDNALKYAPRGTVITVELSADGADHWRLAVRDQGQGIPAALRERVFEPYARLDRDLERGGRVSRGLGLAFCRKAAELHGGRIWVEDNPPQGSAFVARLPRDPRATAPAAPVPTAA